MPKPRIALKRLTAADLSFFKWHFENQLLGGKQKAFNMNRDVFVDVLYPAVPEIAEEIDGGRFPIDLTIFGPCAKPAYNLQRKILRQHKNWRLDGEFVENPHDDSDRFNILTPDDYAIIEFTGVAYPTAANLYLISHACPEDEPLHAIISAEKSDEIAGRHSMIALGQDDLEKLVVKSCISEIHPVYALLMGEAIEDAALGGATGKEKIWSTPAGPAISPDALKKAKRRADDIGRQGEEHFNEYLMKIKDRGEIADFKWKSDENAVAPYDFEIFYFDGSKRLADVKSTSGDFGRKIHVSLNELKLMAHGDSEYALCRAYSVTENTAKLRIASNTKTFALSILEVLSNLPEGIQADSVSIDPQLLDFDEELDISPIQSVFD